MCNAKRSRQGTLSSSRHRYIALAGRKSSKDFPHLKSSFLPKVVVLIRNSSCHNILLVIQCGQKMSPDTLTLKVRHDIDEVDDNQAPRSKFAASPFLPARLLPEEHSISMECRKRGLPEAMPYFHNGNLFWRESLHNFRINGQSAAVSPLPIAWLLRFLSF